MDKIHTFTYKVLYLTYNILYIYDNKKFDCMADSVLIDIFIC